MYGSNELFSNQTSCLDVFVKYLYKDKYLIFLVSNLVNRIVTGDLRHRLNEFPNKFRHSDHVKVRALNIVVYSFLHCI